MGYYTTYSLDVVKGNASLIAELVEESEYAAYAIDEDGDSVESCKWYGHDKQLREFSLKHPNALFKLSGEGEESGDIWHAYYQNGLAQRCEAKLVFDEFDENKLK